MSRHHTDIFKDLAAKNSPTTFSLNTFDPKPSSNFRLPHSYYILFVGLVRHKKCLLYLANQVQNMEDTEKLEVLLKYVDLDKDGNLKDLIGHRGQNLVYEDHFNQFLLDKFGQMLSFTRLKDVCRYYETRPDVNVDKIMIEHEERTRKSTPYFTNKGLSLDEAQAVSLALSFYTGTNSEVLSQTASLVVRQSNGYILSEKIKDEFDPVHIVLYYLVKALSYIPFYWGWTVRAIQLTDNELGRYIPGCLIAWIQFSSSKAGYEVAKNFDFAERNTYFRIYSLTGRSIKQFSNSGNEEDEVLFLPHSTFLILRHDINGIQHTIYMREVELGLSERSVLWVDDKIFDRTWENKRHMEDAATQALNSNVHFIPKSSTERALSFLQSPFGQHLMNRDTFHIVTDMNRENEYPVHNAGARFIKQLRELGFENQCLVFTSSKEKAEEVLEAEFDSKNFGSVGVTTSVKVLKEFINFKK